MPKKLFSPRSAMLGTAATAGIALVAMNLPAAATSKAAVHRDNTGAYSDSVSGGAVLSANNADGSNPFNDYGVEGKVSNDTGGVGILGYGQQAKSYGVYGVTFGTNGIGVYGAGDGPAPASGATPSSSQQSTGVVGDSHSGDGTYGSTEFPNGSDVLLSPVAGVFGVDTTTNGTDNNGVYGLTTNGGFGVAGVSSSNGNKSATGGVFGYGTTGYGVAGSSKTVAGVIGQGVGTAANNFGVYGISGATDGIYGVTGGPAGTYGVGGTAGGAGNGVGGAASSDAAYGVVGDNSATTNAHSGAGVLAESSATTALYATTSTSSGFGADVVNSNGAAVGAFATTVGVKATTTGSASNGVEIHVPTGTLPDAIYALNPSNAVIFAVDGDGDVEYAGTFGAEVRTRNGFVAKSYSSRESVPSIGDVGSGQIVNGTGLVRLDPALVEQMDRSTAYHVFITPDGDTRGLYVASKTPQGFIVKETQGGRGTLGFDYRIVAAVDGQAGTRMALARSATRAKMLASDAVHQTPAHQSVTIATEAKTAALQAKVARLAHESFAPARMFRPLANSAVESRAR